MPPLRIVQGSRPAMAWLRWLTRGFFGLGTGKRARVGARAATGCSQAMDATMSLGRLSGPTPTSLTQDTGSQNDERAAKRPLQASARHGASRVGSSLAQTQKCPALPLHRAQFQLCIFSYTRLLRGARVMFLCP